MDVIDRKFWNANPTEARTEVLERWGELVYRLARSVAKGGFSIIDADDLYQVGTVGLFKAVDSFNPDKGVPFESYASIRVMGEMRDHLRRVDLVPQRSRRAIKKLTNTVEELRRRDGAPPTIEQLSNRLGWSVDKVRCIMRRTEWRTVPIQDWDASGPTDPETRTIREEQKQRLHVAFSRLNTAKRYVIKGVFLEGRKAKDIASDLKVSQGRISQVKSEALDELKTLMEISEFDWEE